MSAGCVKTVPRHPTFALPSSYSLASNGDVENENVTTGLHLPVSVPVKARFGRSTYNLQTLDVSPNGAFVVSPKVPAKGQLVHLSVILQTAKKPVALQGMVMLTISGDEARERAIPAGFSLQFYGLGHENLKAWTLFFEDQFKKHLDRGGIVHPPTPALEKKRASELGQAGAHEKGGETTDEFDPLEDTTDEWAPPDEIIDDPPRKSSHSIPPPMLYRVSPPDVDELHRLTINALESGGVTLVGAMGAQPGTPAVVSIIHPESKAEFHVPGEVQPSSAHPGNVSVKFLGVTERTKGEFDRFMKKGEPPPAIGRDLGPPEVEMVIFERPEETQWDLVLDHHNTVQVDKLMPLQRALDPFDRAK